MTVGQGLIFLEAEIGIAHPFFGDQHLIATGLDLFGQVISVRGGFEEIINIFLIYGIGGKILGDMGTRLKKKKCDHHPSKR